MKRTIIISVIAAIIIAAFFVIYFIDKNTITTNNSNTEFTNKLAKQDSIINDLKYKIILQDSLYKVLQQSKSNIETHYETQFKDIDNVSIVSNDSICQYISSKIHSK